MSLEHIQSFIDKATSNPELQKKINEAADAAAVAEIAKAEGLIIADDLMHNFLTQPKDLSAKQLEALAAGACEGTNIAVTFGIDVVRWNCAEVPL
ncbi:Nif11-like leader peptide family RiPP precursor [bacterium]|nr:Nif11-like leader peptide family RiPP precursor [bacterium]